MYKVKCIRDYFLSDTGTHIKYMFLTEGKIYDVLKEENGYYWVSDDRRSKTAIGAYRNDIFKFIEEDCLELPQGITIPIPEQKCEVDYLEITKSIFK